MKKATLTHLDEEIIVMACGDLTRILYHNILFIEYSQPYVFIHTSLDKKYCVFTSLLSIAEKLPLHFHLCNRSTIINLSYVNFIGKENQGYVLKLNSGKIFRVSRRKYKLALEQFGKIQH